MIYNERNGYGLQFTKFDEQYNDTIIYRKTKEEIIRLAETILVSLKNKSLMGELNTMQSYFKIYEEEKGYKTSCFDDKFDIPAYFINLILEKYNMKVLGWL